MAQVEEWRIVAGFDRYEVSNTGLVRNRQTGLVLRPRIDSHGYLCVILYDQGRRTARKIHKLVANAFIGDSEGRVVDHISRDKSNNSVSNLRYCSQSDNLRNKSSNKGRAYRFVSTLPDEAIELNEYGTHQFDNLYYHDGAFYVFTGLEYRILEYLTNAGTGSIYVWTYDTEHRDTKINVAKYRRSIGDLP
jgi:hypothetical protein